MNPLRDEVARRSAEGPSSTRTLINSSGKEKERHLDMKMPLIKRLDVPSQDCQFPSQDELIVIIPYM